MNGSQDGIMGYHPQNLGYPLGTTLPSSRPPGAARSLLLPLAVPSLASWFLLTLMLPGCCPTSISGVGGSIKYGSWGPEETLAVSPWVSHLLSHLFLQLGKGLLDLIRAGKEHDSDRCERDSAEPRAQQRLEKRQESWLEPGLFCGSAAVLLPWGPGRGRPAP